MQNFEQRYYELAEKWMNGTITGAEKEEFLQWYHEHLDDPVSIPAEFAVSEEDLKKRIFNSIQKKKSQRVIFLAAGRKYWWAAASVIIILGVSGIFYLKNNAHQTVASRDLVIDEGSAPVVKPGGDKAILTLSDGSTIVLDSAGTGLITREKNSRILKLDNGQVAYQPSQNQNIEVAYNTISTPVGGQYAIVLADGTKVWLNSSSSLHFPTAFNGKERIVDLKGEGYFEVAKNAHMPFKVRAGETEVKVLGTHFNVMAYDDEAEMKTTLLEGSVQVEERGAKAIIEPGQQVSSNKQGILQVHKEVNTEQAVAWKNGIFQFDQTHLSSIMRQIARWYDVEVINDQHVEGHFSGMITKNVSVEKVLHMLELTGAVHFTISGRRIYVYN